MASEKRQQNNSVREQLLKEFYGFPFFKAVGLLERLFPDKKPVGGTLLPAEEAVRFSVKPGLAFPPNEISNLQQKDGKRPLDMEVAFMGLIGPSGVLPQCFNELAIERSYKKDFSLIAFLNIFHHRLISLFYLAWKKYRLSENYLRGPKDKISPCFLSLSGMGTKGLLEKLPLPDKSLIPFFSGYLSRTVTSVAALESAVGCFSGVPAHIEQFIERLIPLAPEDQTQLGAANAQLGTSAMCGSHIWECRTMFRVNLGPMDLKSFIRFLPGGGMLQPLSSLVRYMAGIEYEYEIRLLLKRDEVPSCVLGQESPVPSLLGWTTWIKAGGTVLDNDAQVTFGETFIEAA